MSQVKSLLRVPYGLRGGKMWAARDVPMGLACGCLCVGCEQPLVAKNQGIKIRPHFAHHVDRACQGAFESSIHRRAKELIADKGLLMLPAWDGDETMPNPPSAADDDRRLHFGQRVDLPAKLATLTEAQTEVQRGDYRPDVVAQDSEGELLIEVRVTHAVGELKTRNVQCDGQRMMEIDLSKISAEQAEDTELFEQLVLNTASNRLWISYPAGAQAWRNSRDELKERIRAMNVDIAARRAHRQKLQNENETERKARADRKEKYRQKLREPCQMALAALSEKTSRGAIKSKYQHLLDRDQAKADRIINSVTQRSARSYLRTIPSLGWVYDAHPYLWQAGAYIRFIEGKPPGHAFEQADLGRWIRKTYGEDEALWTLFRAQWVARSEALKRGHRMRLPWAWFFSPDENKRIPNFFEPIDEFVGNMMRCGVLIRDPHRRGWLTVCEMARRRAAPLQSPAMPSIPAQFLPVFHTSPVEVVPTSIPTDQASDPLLGRRIRLHDLGIGVVIKRVVHCRPVYDVRFGRDNPRRILLQSDQQDWRLVDPPSSATDKPSFR